MNIVSSRQNFSNKGFEIERFKCEIEFVTEIAEERKTVVLKVSEGVKTV